MDPKAQYAEDVKILKEWHCQQPHLPKEIDDNLYYTFVSGTNSIEKSKSKLDAYLTLRNPVFNLFELQPTIDGFRERFKNAGVCFLPDKSPEGWKVLCFMPGKFGETCNDDIMISSLLVIDAMHAIEPTETTIMTISNLGHVSTNMASIELMKLKAHSSFFTKTLPLKIKKVILAKAPYFFDKLINLWLALAPKKITERTIKYKDETYLQELLPIEMIPLELGGKGPSYEGILEHWIGIIESKKDWFEKQSKLVADESRRPKDTYKWDTMEFGIDGSFKSLTID